ncbi:hypothetical protein GALMADRAFT_162229 [Galerina marginata CBS 339.88]|uniref:Uncharacterized protein n=1 Tax=Galerina marginata (strain CBS 339.88) TaxID=685588 RepID=A0A067S5U5_GALM3|nr:hypothetical protein GALMADRAFT_162229 [Galerina marginata CBS 339.88]
MRTISMFRAILRAPKSGAYVLPRACERSRTGYVNACRDVCRRAGSTSFTQSSVCAFFSFYLSKTCPIRSSAARSRFKNSSSSLATRKRLSTMARQPKWILDPAEPEPPYLLHLHAERVADDVHPAFSGAFGGVVQVQVQVRFGAQVGIELMWARWSVGSRGGRGRRQLADLQGTRFEPIKLPDFAVCGGI